ncbi:MAG TPA: DNA repair protein RecN [Actinomycetaceae bacterium]|nr:DNA repair protein RecN [Actinomycetaceae bacterium]
MIEELTISNLGAIDAAHLEFGPGLTVITGETGAGKTMLLTGLELLLGGPSDPGMVRSAAERAAVEAVFLVSEDGPVRARAQEAGAEIDDGALVVARTLPAQGRSRGFAGGRSVPRAVLAELGAGLVVIHGQSDQLQLRQPARQRATLDRYAGQEHRETLAAYRRVWHRLGDLREELEHWHAHSRDRQQEAAHLRAGLELLETVAPLSGEDTALRDEAERLTNVEDRRAAASAAHGALSGSDETPEVTDAVTLVAQAAQALGSEDPDLAALGERLTAATHQLTDVAAELSAYLDGLEADPHRLAHIHERRATLREATTRLMLNHPDELADWSATAAARLAALEDPDESLGAIREAIAQAETELAKLGQTVSAGRARAADELSAAVSVELEGLAMPGARLHVELAARADLGPWGAEDVSIELTPHPGAPPRPLGVGASGGELSRVMLALEVVLATRPGPTSAPATMVFDEVDAGIGGRAATEVGRRLARLARHRQVIVVTHLAQVAAFADHHLLVRKTSDTTATATDVVGLTEADRLQELARMLSGQTDSTVAQRHAAELLELAAVAR